MSSHNSLSCPVFLSKHPKCRTRSTSGNKTCMDWIFPPSGRLPSTTTIISSAIPRAFLGEPKPLGSIRFAQAESTYVKGAASFEITHPGVMHGIAGWLSLDLTPEITISNSPSEPNVHWGHAFFPVDTPVTVNTGDAVYRWLLALMTVWSGDGRWE